MLPGKCFQLFKVRFDFMCGIFGIVSDNNIDIKKLTRVSKVLRHRGPDDEGYLLFNKGTDDYAIAKGADSISSINAKSILSCSGYNSAFLHRRLSIIDLSPAGHQPMSYDNDRFWVVFNGEIYNYIELREQLIKKGHNFKSTSDTEVLLASYQEWGQECVERFNGIWAFAVWDKQNSCIFLSRDRLGVKPLYYYCKNDQTLFCSEIKGIREYLNGCLTLNERNIFQYLIRGRIVTGESYESIFDEIKCLSAGTNLILKNNKISETKYWNISLNKNELNFNENVEKFRELFQQSIKFQLRSDVEVGACLSGGLDSSSLVTFASSTFNKRFHTFSAIWPGEKCDESYYIDKVNAKCNCYSNAFTPEMNNLITIIDQEIWHQEIPLSGSSAIAQWFVMAKAKEKGIKVLLDGQGADEILSGYPYYLTPFINEMIFSFKWKELQKYSSSLKNSGYSTKWFLSIQRYRFISPFNRPAFPIKKSLLSRYRFGTKQQNGYICSSLPKFLKDHIEKSNLPDLLHYEDRNSMAHSIESRVPFLDHNLVEFAVNIPSEQKIHGALTKIILRESMKPFLPVEIYNRTDKIGFSTPIERNLFNKGGKFYYCALDYIENSDLYKMGVLDMQLLNENHIFGLYTLAKFLDMWS